MNRSHVRQRVRYNPGLGTWPWAARAYYWVVTWKIQWPDGDAETKHRVCRTKSEAELHANAMAKLEQSRDVRVNYTCRVAK